MADTKLGKQSVYRAYLHAGAATMVAQFSGIDVVRSIRPKTRQRAEAINDVFARARPGKSLQQFLQNQPSGDDHLTAFEGLVQFYNLGDRRTRIAAKCERPNAGIDKQGQDRERSAL